MVNFFLSGPVPSGIAGTSNSRSLTQYSAQRSSISFGSYAFGRSRLITCLSLAFASYTGPRHAISRE